MDSSFSAETRRSNIAKMAAGQLDLVVIGSGVTGAGVARDAAMRGIRTGIIDKGDFASGTSGKSSRLIHGGLRYLEMGHLGLVFEASRERRTLLRIAPHLVWPRSFIFPIHSGSRIPRWKLLAGLWLYDILALFRNVRRHEALSKQELIRAEPNLRQKGLKGGARYYDAQCDDSRLTLANVRSAHSHGALAANYVEMSEFDIADGAIQGIRVTDLVTGEKHVIRARVVVNATGPWSDNIRKELDGKPLLRPTKGAHVAVPRNRLGNNEAVTMTSPIDGRVMFIIPWGELSYIGTTDTDDDIDPGATCSSAEDVVYLLRSANAMFPNARLQVDDVVSSWAGLRPLLRPMDPRDPSSVSREHKIVEDPLGMISIVGGKLTTYREMAAQVVNRVARKLRSADGTKRPARSGSNREPLPGGESKDTEVLVREVTREGYPIGIAQSLVRRFGTESAAVLRLARSNRELAKPIAQGHPSLRAELIFACRREMALTLSDLLVRRTHVFYESPDHGLEQISEIASLVAVELGWSVEEERLQVRHYTNLVHDCLAFKEEFSARQRSELGAG